MNFVCGKCGTMGFINSLAVVQADLEEKHRIWGATCAQCKFSGKSRVDPTAWNQLQAQQQRGDRRKHGTGRFGQRFLRTLDISLLELPTFSLFK